MKNRTKKTIIILTLSVLIAIAPIYFLIDGYQSISIYADLSKNVKYIEDYDIVTYKFSNRESAEKASAELKQVNAFADIILMPCESTLVQSYACNSVPNIKYTKNGTFNGKDKYFSSISNGDTNVFQSFSTYQLSPELVKSNLLKLTDGEMIDFGKKGKDYIEILVTDGFGAAVDDELFFTVNGLDKELKQVVVKAKVVGIVSKGSFLYGCSEYCGRVAIPETLHNSIFEEEMVFTDDIAYLYEYEGAPNNLLDEDIPIFLLGLESNIQGATANSIVSENGGELVKLNASESTLNIGATELNNVIVILAACLAALIVILTSDIIIIKKLNKRS